MDSQGKGESHRKFKDKPQRLERIFQSYDPPLYFLTICTLYKRAVLANPAVHASFIAYARRGAEEQRAAVGRYVIMPDHVHLFVRLGRDMKLGLWVRGLKRCISAKTGSADGFWQPGFFDHVVRHSESYAEKWAYVAENPVRTGLVATASEWLYQGEIVRLEM